MSYYHDIVVQKSWEELSILRRNLDFLLIGGWAVYFYTKGLKSKDIDIIVSFEHLSRIEKLYSLSKNERLRKYEARKQEIQIDIYLPHYSDLGIPVVDLIDKEEKIDGYRVLQINYLFALKMHALANRGRSEKGRKDFLDLISLWQTEKVNGRTVKEIMRKHQLYKDVKVWREFLQEAGEIKELNLNYHQFSRLRKQILQEFAS